MKKSILLISLGFLSTACHTVYVDVKKDNVKLAEGYYNSSGLDFGDVWAWNTKENYMVLEYSLRDKPYLGEPYAGGEYSAKKTSLSSDTAFSVSGNVSAVTALNQAAGQTNNGTSGSGVSASIGSDISALSSVTLTNCQRVNYNSPVDLLNQKKLANVREDLASRYKTSSPSANWRLIFVYRGYQGEDIKINVNTTVSGSANANVFTYGNYSAKLTYSGSNALELSAPSGKNVPLVVGLYVLKFGDQNNLTEDKHPPTAFNLQTVSVH